MQQQAGDGAIGARSAVEQTPALVIGDLAHRFLQHWDFAKEPGDFRGDLNAWVERWLPEQWRGQRALIENELAAVFRPFFGAPIYREIAQSRLLGREVPFLMPWNGQVMEGVIDLVYEREGLLYLADYKTDRIGREDLAQHAERYRTQADIYSQAVRRSLKAEVAAFKLIFLRLGEAVEIKPSAEQGEILPNPTL